MTALAVTLTVAELEAMMERAAERGAARALAGGAAHEPDPWLDTAAAAELLRVDPRSIRNFVQRDGLPAHRVGKLYRFRRAELLAWIEARRGPR